ncbi:phosphoglycerate mutase-like protein [Apiospora arundinis]
MQLLLPLLLAAPLAAAHGAVTSYIIGGKTYPGYEGFSPQPNAQIIQRQWPDYNPIMSVTDGKMTCNGGTSWTHQQGPVMVWMYPCGSGFQGCDGKGKNWFKIDQMGLYGASLNSNDWGTGVIYKSLKWSSKIPASLKPGKYLIRHELLALHQANTPQFYPECAQLDVTGSGSATPSGSYLASIPAYAKQSDPGIMVDIYQGKATTYKCPGPDVWTG